MPSRRPCLLCPQKRTCASLPGYVRFVEKRTPLFDHLVGTAEQRQRHRDAKRMQLKDTLHPPPAGINALLTVTANVSWTLVLVPVDRRAVILVGFASTYNRLTCYLA